MCRLSLFILLCLVASFSAGAQSSISGWGYYNGSPMAMITPNGAGASAYAPGAFTLTGYNATGLTPGSVTYTSGLTATGAQGTYCNVTVGGGTTNAVGQLVLTGTNAVAAGTGISFSGSGYQVGTGYASAPTAATATSGSATCSGTLVVASALGAYAPFAVDSLGNILGNISGLPPGWTLTGSGSSQVVTAPGTVAAGNSSGTASTISLNGTTGSASFSGALAVGTEVVIPQSLLPSASTVNVVCLGDSICGYVDTGSTYIGYLEAMPALAGRVGTTTICSYSGQTIAYIASQYAACVHPASPTVTGIPAILMFEGGTNNIVGGDSSCTVSTAATCIATMESGLAEILAAATSDGFVIGVSTVMPRAEVLASAGVDYALRVPFNNWLRGQYFSGSFKFLFDWDQLVQNPYDPQVLVSGIVHPTAQTRKLMALQMNAALQGNLMPPLAASAPISESPMAQYSLLNGATIGFSPVSDPYGLDLTAPTTASQINAYIGAVKGFTLNQYGLYMYEPIYGTSFTSTNGPAITFPSTGVMTETAANQISMVIGSTTEATLNQYGLYMYEPIYGTSFTSTNGPAITFPSTGVMTETAANQINMVIGSTTEATLNQYALYLYKPINDVELDLGSYGSLTGASSNGGVVTLTGTGRVSIVNGSTTEAIFDPTTIYLYKPVSSNSAATFTSGTFTSISATTGTPFVCVNTSGQLVKSATACSGT